MIVLDASPSKLDSFVSFLVKEIYKTIAATINKIMIKRKAKLPFGLAFVVCVFKGWIWGKLFTVSVGVTLLSVPIIFVVFDVAGSTAAPQFLQNLLPDSKSVPQYEHFIISPINFPLFY